MPIVIAQPEPFAPEIASAYGRAQAIQAANSDLANLYARQGQMRQQALQAQADRESQGNRANYANAQSALNEDAQVALARDRLQLDRLNLAARQSVSPAEEFQAFQAQARQQAHAQTQAQLMQLHQSLEQQDLTFKENLRLDRMKNALAEVMADQNLTPEEKANFGTYLKTGIDPLQRRYEEQQARQARQHADLYEQQAIQREEVTRKNAVLDAQTFESRMRTVDTPEGGKATLYQTGYDANGRPTWQQIAQPKAERTLPFDHAKAVKDAEKIAEAEIPATEVDPITGKPKVTSEMLAQRAATVARYVTKMAQEHEARQPPRDQNRAVGYQGGAGAPPQTLAPEPKPFAVDNPQAPQDVLAVRQYKAERTRIESSDSPEPMRKEAVRALDDAMKIYAQYGSVAAMPDNVRMTYLALGTIARQYAPLPKPPAPPPVPVARRAERIVPASESLWGGPQRY